MRLLYLCSNSQKKTLLLSLKNTQHANTYKTYIKNFTSLYITLPAYYFNIKQVLNLKKYFVIKTFGTSSMPHFSWTKHIHMYAKDTINNLFYFQTP